jgi:NAD(P)-dependent dehydrogenase (short-subunit alcohol dehydrogenase family)
MSERGKGKGADELSGKTAIVTGASRGIGEKIAFALAGRGVNLALAARSKEALEKNAEAIRRQSHTETLVCPIDVRNEGEVIEAVERIVRAFGGVDYLINNAGFVDPIGILEMTVENWDRVIETNLKGTFLFTREVVRYSMKERGGKIINVASTAGLTPRPGWSAYAASKAAIINFSQTMSEELKEYGIKVYCISPGRTATELRRILAPDEDPATILQPEDIADTVVFLLSAAGDFVDGQSITIRRR